MQNDFITWVLNQPVIKPPVPTPTVLSSDDLVIFTAPVPKEYQ